MRPALLSVNINKYALLRNSRGRNTPDLLWAVDTCLSAGAHGITVHPRMDLRHIRFDDVPEVHAHLQDKHPGVELNVECEDHPFLLDLVRETRPAQCTLVPVKPGEVTSDHGWEFPRDTERLKPTVARLKAAGVRVSIFMGCETAPMKAAAAVGVDRVELYTGPYAWAFGTPAQKHETKRLLEAVKAANDVGLGVNAGHDLDRHNVVPLRGAPILEMSIGHAQIVRALDVGTRQSVRELLMGMGWP